MRSPHSLSSLPGSDTNTPLSDAKPSIKRRRLGPPTPSPYDPTLALSRSSPLPASIHCHTDALRTLPAAQKRNALAACVSCYKSLAILPVSQVAECSRCQASMCMICSRTCTYLPPLPPVPKAAPCMGPPSHHLRDSQAQRTEPVPESRRLVRRLPRRGQRTALGASTRHQTQAPACLLAASTIEMLDPCLGCDRDASMEDVEGDGMKCPDGTLRYGHAPHIHRRDSNASEGGCLGGGDRRREGCGQVVCKGCAVEDVQSGDVACRRCLGG